MIKDFFDKQSFSKKVKASHTRYRALGPELIPVLGRCRPGAK